MSLLLKVLGLAGGAIPTGWIVAAAIGVFTAYTGGVWLAGANYQEAKDDVAALRLEVEQQKALAVEKDRQVQAVTTIQQRDAERARTAEGKLRERETAVLTNVLPNSTKCFDDQLPDRVFGRPLGNPTRQQRPAGAAGSTRH
jgi:hypothetical protein